VTALGPTGVFAAYVLAFGGAALACLIALGRARRIDDPGTRVGLVGLLAGSGGWAALIVGFLIAPTDALARASYLASLVVGLTTIGAWLHFCSAYTGRTFHRDPVYRRAAVAVYLAIVAIKLTNPVHGLYYTTATVTVPFAHLTVQHGLVHWLVTGLSYALAAVGFFMLYETFLEADYDTRPLAALVGVTALPVVFDVAGFASPRLIDINYEPLGVAVFAVGVLYVFRDRFFTLQLTGGVDEAVVSLDDGGRVREANGRAIEVFPALAGARGEPFEAALPEVAARLDADLPVVERRRDGETRYYLVSETSFGLGGADVGGLVVLTDVTETERQRRELERHNEQLEWFATGIRHELRNSLQIADGWITLAGEALDRGELHEARDGLQTATRQTGRMNGLVTDFAEIAQYGKTPGELVSVAIGDAAEAAAPDELEVTVQGATSVRANQPRLQRLFEHAFEFAAYNGASTVSVRPTDDGFTVAGDGRPLGDEDPEAYFDHANAVPDAEAGTSLPNVRMLARAQGWSVSVDTTYDDGIRIRVSGAAVDRATEDGPTPGTSTPT